VAPGTTPPWASFTVPATVPVVICALALMAPIHKATIASAAARSNRILVIDVNS
jgi:hypothetical protein